jgi:peptide deformylase
MWRVGLAAPQVGESLQLAVLEGRPEFHKQLNETQVEEWQSTSSPEVSAYEGCLSIPGFLQRADGP